MNKQSLLVGKGSNTNLLPMGMKSMWTILFGWLVLAAPAPMHAQSIYSYDDFDYTINGGSISIVGYTGVAEAVTIPATINGHSVTSIGYRAFQDRFSLTSVSIPATVTSIGDYAFYICGLTNVTIPSSVTNIGVGAFNQCYYLNNVSIPNGITSVAGDAFYYCTSLTSITIPNSVTNIGANAFAHCTSLKDLTIPNTVTTIGTNAFAYCTALTRVTIPGSVTNVGMNTFSYCTNLTSVTLGNGTTTIGTNEFLGCTNLSGITIPASVTIIDDGAFVFTGLTNVTIPGSVTSLGGAFAQCYDLTNVTIPGSVTNIGDAAFYLCISLNSLYFHGNAPTVAWDAFLYDNKATAYYLPATAGWSSTFYISSFGDIPAVLWTTPPTIAITAPTSASNYSTTSSTISISGTASDGMGVTNVTWSNHGTGDAGATDGTTSWTANKIGLASGVNVITVTAFDAAGYHKTATLTVTYITGSLQVTITPPAAISVGGRWQVDGGALQNSGATVSNLSLGNHNISFNTISGWVTPANQTVSVSTNSSATASGTYAQQFGSLRVTIASADAVNAGAQWQVDDGTLQNSGATVTNLSVGNHTVSFTTISGWTTPPNETVSVSVSTTTSATGTYVQQFGSLKVSISPASASTAGAKWQVDDGKFQNSAATVFNLSVGNHTVSFNTISGWTTPASQTVAVNDDSTATASGVYVVVPSIVTQPANESAALGGIATFSVKATGAPLTYQWIFDGAPLSDNRNISGSATNKLTVNLIASNNFGSYSVVVSNSFISVTSKVVQLTLSRETTKPSVSISSPTANSRTNAPVLNGTASDDVRVLNVAYWLTNVNNGVKTTVNGIAALVAGIAASSNWTIQTTLLPGTNILAVQSSNYAGLASPVERAVFFYRVATPLQLAVSPAGMGTVTGVASVRTDAPPKNVAALYVGEGYTVTANPAFNWWLTNWTTNAVIAGTNTTLAFTMESNLVVTANFATNLFVGMAARYDGIFYPSSPQTATQTNSGLIYNLVLGTNGIYSGKLYLASATPYTLAGAFNRSGQATETIDRLATAGGNLTLELNIPWQSVPRQITGLLQGTNAGGWISTNLNLYAAATNMNNPSNYTMLLPQDTNVADAPPSYGYALITNIAGMIHIGGALSDGTSFSSFVEPINDQDEFPVYASLYNNTGLLLGQLSLDATNNATVPAGSLIWFKPVLHTGLYTNGISTGLEVEGSPWTNSAAALAAFTNEAQLTFSGGGLASNLVSTVQLTSTNTLKWVGGSTNFTSGFLNRTNGQLTVNFHNTSSQKVTASGEILQNTNLGGGFFMGKTNAGSILLRP